MDSIHYRSLYTNLTLSYNYIVYLHEGIVKKTSPSEDVYLIEDGVGEVEEVERGDIITDDDDAPNVIRV